MNTLKEICTHLAASQKTMVNDLTEKAPILAEAKWIPTTHGLWNVAEKVDDITGPGFVPLNAPLPLVGTSTSLAQVHVSILGGEMEVSKDVADAHGGAIPYFDKKQPLVLAKAGMDTETTLYYDNWQRAALDAKNVIDCGGAQAEGKKLYSMVICRFDQASNVGIYDATMFNTEELLHVDGINDGKLYHLRSQPGVLGYGVSLKGRFGWQILSGKCVATLINIQEGHVPTKSEIDSAIAMVHGTPSDTRIFCHEMCKVLAINPHRNDRIQILQNDGGFYTTVEAWNRIPIITSYNLKDGTEAKIPWKI